MNEKLLGFWEHLDELRRTLLFAFGIIIAGTLGSLYFSQELIALLIQPLNQLDPAHPPQLILLGPLEGILTAFKLSAWIGIVGTSPFWLLAVMRFMAPGLKSAERQLLILFLGLSFLSMGAGAYFGWIVTLPLANQYLLAYNASLGMNLWTLSNYLDYTLALLLANAFAFELGSGLLFLVHIGVVRYDAMKSMRRHAILGAFILGAILTPPDIPTQILMAVPLIGLYEVATLYARWRAQREEKNNRILGWTG